MAKSARTSIPRSLLDRLYGAPPQRFVAVRKEIADELTKQAKREAAASIRSLRKPALAASAINRAVLSQPEQASALNAAARQLRQAHQRAIRGKGDRDALRDAAAEERQAIATMFDTARDILVKDGKPPSESVADRIKETLEAVALDDDLMERFTSARLEEPQRAAGLALTAVDSSERAAPRTKKSDTGASTRRRAQARRELREAEARERRASTEVDRRRRAVDKAGADLRRAEQELEEALADLAEARSETTKARKRSER